MLNGKTARILRSLGSKRNNEIGVQVEKLMKTELRWLVHKYIRLYVYASTEILGMTVDDLKQHIRLELWMGIATFDESRGVKLETYLSVVLFYFFLSLNRKMKFKKNNMTRLHCVSCVHLSTEQSDSHSDAFQTIVDSLDQNYFFSKLSQKEMAIFEYYYVDLDSAFSSYSVGFLKNDGGRERSGEAARVACIKEKEVAGILRGLRNKMVEHIKEMEDFESEN